MNRRRFSSHGVVVGIWWPKGRVFCVIGPRIVALEARDIRFPTSRALDGSDAMNPDPDYSAAYVVLRTDAGDGLEGHGLTFTIGRGNELCVAAARAFAPLVVGLTLGEITADMGAFWRSARRRHAAPMGRSGEGRPAPRDRGGRQRRVGSLGEGRGQAAVEAARRHEPRGDRALRRLPLHHRRAHARARRSSCCSSTRRVARRARRELERDGYPAYTTSAGWLGYSDEKVARSAAKALPAAGRTSRSRSGATSTTTCAAPRSSARRSGPIAS